MPRVTNRREFLQCADTYDHETDIAGFYISEKLDGGRCFWDGGVTRGVCTEYIPWAGLTDPKTGKRKAKIKPIATGLWSRYGNPIMAPDWYLDKLPPMLLDGELWAGRGCFQKCMKAIRTDEPIDDLWEAIQYAVYSSPSVGSMFANGEIKNPNMHCTIDLHACLGLYHSSVRHDWDWTTMTPTTDFESELENLKKHPWLGKAGYPAFVHEQTKLSDNKEQAVAEADTFFRSVLLKGGEGVVLRDPKSVWIPKRHKGVLKYKPLHDAEGTLVGFTSGRATHLGSKLLGMIGALILDYNGQRLELSGLTDEERQFYSQEMSDMATENPGRDMPSCVRSKHFKLGQTITFQYRDVTDDGLPKEARYYRVREEV